jgi:hypothetical protein
MDKRPASAMDFEGTGSAATSARRVETDRLGGGKQ